MHPPERMEYGMSGGLLWFLAGSIAVGHSGRKSIAKPRCIVTHAIRDHRRPKTQPKNHQTDLLEDLHVSLLPETRGERSLVAGGHTSINVKHDSEGTPARERSPPLRCVLAIPAGCWSDHYAISVTGLSTGHVTGHRAADKITIETTVYAGELCCRALE